MMNRRKFMQATAMTAASYSRVLGANDRLSMSLIGTGRRGRDVMRALLATGRVELISLCDVYDEQRKKTRELLVPGKTPKEFGAHEEALAQAGLDAVLIATPDHWHLDIAQDALKAKKHVYLEKPAVHQFAEATRSCGHRGNPIV
jgi:predicted dehydrogenase